MITKDDASEELKNSLSNFEIAIPAFNLAILALLYQIDTSSATDAVQSFYKTTLVLTLSGVFLLPFYSLLNWSQSRLKLYAFDTAEKYKDQLLDMAKRNDTTSKLGNYMSTSDKWRNKFHLLDVKITKGMIRVLVPLFFVDMVSFVVLTALIKM
ncbi:hypothetical protein [Marinobacterium aestuariivivens]|uniref:ABC transmembrane type-1 domain-containing protein n=1 Tax=Marinobacterium aestuariivivens TaxID=1698799 RepID=A0ABW2A4L8_9GAMM